MVSHAQMVEIEQLGNRYVHLADWLNKGEAEAPGGPVTVGDVFADDAVFRLGESTYAGHEAISQLFSPAPTVHSTSNTYVYTDGDTIRVRSKFAFVNLATGETMVGDYDDVVVATPDGWRIAERVTRMRAIAPAISWRVVAT
jgi:SnoaL-like domain